LHVQVWKAPRTGAVEDIVKPLTIFLHDYAGHPFQAELSRALAARGHRVIHAFFAGDPGPKGDLETRIGDPATLSFAPIDIGAPYPKGDFLRRRFLDVRYGRTAAKAIASARPDLVISGNTPTEAQTAILNAARGANAKFIYWCQDFFSIAVAKILARKLPAAAAVIGGYYKALERAQMRDADAVVLITEDFAPLAQSWGVPRERIHVVPNWGAIEQIPVLPKDNSWARAHDLADKFVYLYSGTIGLKHNPDLLATLAARRQDDPRVRVVAVAAGTGVERLRARKAAEGLDNLLLLDLQPFERLPEVLATADVLTAVIENDAGAFSVPSKVLSYLCAQRPILLAAPEENLASKTVRSVCAGMVANPEDIEGWLAAAAQLEADAALRERLAGAGRSYAETNFDIARVTDRFEALFAATADAPRGTKSAAFWRNVWGARASGGPAEAAAPSERLA
jgi:glycosyltransferase involved in cell wall biosynthesis